MPPSCAPRSVFSSDFQEYWFGDKAQGISKLNTITKSNRVMIDDSIAQRHHCRPVLSYGCAKKWVNPEISCECFWSMDQRTSFALPDMGKHQKRSKDETHLPKLTAVLCL